MAGGLRDLCKLGNPELMKLLRPQSLPPYVTIDDTRIPF
jgi:hypothetical protein